MSDEDYVYGVLIKGRVHRYQDEATARLIAEVYTDPGRAIVVRAPLRWEQMPRTPQPGGHR